MLKILLSTKINKQRVAKSNISIMAFIKIELLKRTQRSSDLELASIVAMDDDGSG
jgi:hypothetical protein